MALTIETKIYLKKIPKAVTVQRSSGPAVQRSSGPAVQRTSGPADQRTSGPEFQATPKKRHNFQILTHV
ncbi:hypothetical protein N9127_02655 [Akkermansiaceae bacterium]|nr:hypothetical protein [Akkermansiaceae bacterium]